MKRLEYIPGSLTGNNASLVVAVINCCERGTTPVWWVTDDNCMMLKLRHKDFNNAFIVTDK